MPNSSANCTMPGIIALTVSKDATFNVNKVVVGITAFSRPRIKNDHKLFIVWKPMANSRPPSNMVIRDINKDIKNMLRMYAETPYSHGSGFAMCTIVNIREVAKARNRRFFVRRVKPCSTYPLKNSSSVPAWMGTNIRAVIERSIQSMPIEFLVICPPKTSLFPIESPAKSDRKENAKTTMEEKKNRFRSNRLLPVRTWSKPLLWIHFIVHLSPINPITNVSIAKKNPGTSDGPVMDI